MKKLLVVILLLTSLSYAKDRAWQDGKLVKLTIDTGKGDSSIVANTNQYGTTTAHVNASDEINYYATVRSGNIEYYAGRKLYGRGMPSLTENAPIKFVIDKDVLILKDDRGKEFKMRIGKKTLLD